MTHPVHQALHAALTAHQEHRNREREQVIQHIRDLVHSQNTGASQ